MLEKKKPLVEATIHSVWTPRVLYFIYNVFLTIAFVILLPLVPFLWLLGARYREGLAQRLGWYSDSLTGSLAALHPIWIHAASVGEVRSAVQLVREFKNRVPRRKVLLSTFTATGNRMANELSAADIVLFLPLDLLWIVRRALAVVQPSILIIIETEIWPNLLREAFNRGIPTLLLSGRLSARALPRYSLFALFFHQVLRCFTAIGMQSTEDAERILELGAEGAKVSVVGSLKYAFANPADLDSMISSAPRPEQKPLLVAGSSHRGEEEILLEAFVSLQSRFPNLQMVLAPRHPQRFAEVERLLKATGVSFARKSQVSEDRVFDKEILLLDTLGELQGFFAVADIAFIGGSLVDAGGHNLLEPARFRKPILFGPHMTNFRSIAEQMKQKGGAIEVRGVEDLKREITELLLDSRKRKIMGQQAAEVAANDQGVLYQSMRLAERYL